jgi:predicted transposase/invertase (TIGR01784 family)
MVNYRSKLFLPSNGSQASMLYSKQEYPKTNNKIGKYLALSTHFYYTGIKATCFPKKEKEKYMVKRTVKELSLIDDFLFRETLCDEEDGVTVARLILNVLMDREIENVVVRTQQVLTPGETDRRGIRMDVYVTEERGEGGTIYDIEVQNENQLEQLPRRTRYYQGVIDTQHLASGEDFNDMKPLWIFIITPTDLFGKGRMCYTFENRCVEVPDLSLDDGAKRVFLNDKGSVDCKDDLAELLRYIVDSREENAVNETTKQLHNIVERVKQRPNMGVNYMMVIERDAWARAQGREEEREQNIEASILALADFDISEKAILEKLVTRFHITEEKAKEYLEKYYPSNH